MQDSGNQYYLIIFDNTTCDQPYSLVLPNGQSRVSQLPVNALVVSAWPNQPGMNLGEPPSHPNLPGSDACAPSTSECFPHSSTYYTPHHLISDLANNYATMVGQVDNSQVNNTQMDISQGADFIFGTGWENSFANTFFGTEAFSSAYDVKPPELEAVAQTNREDPASAVTDFKPDRTLCLGDFFPADYKGLLESDSVAASMIPQASPQIENLNKTALSVEQPFTYMEKAEMAKNKELLWHMNNIVNNLTMQNIDKQVMEIRKLSIDTEERLKVVVDCIYEKAIAQCRFCEPCAHMCVQLQTLKVPSSKRTGVHVTFYKLLMNRCQRDFEKDKNDTVEQKKAELNATTEVRMRQHLEEELEEVQSYACHLSLGNIRFISELFKLNLVRENVIHSCVSKLLQKRNEESMKRLCRLMYISGKLMDTKNKPFMDGYFNYMKLVIKEKKAPSEIRVMMEGLVDLRQNNWVPRRLRSKDCRGK